MFKDLEHGDSQYEAASPRLASRDLEFLETARCNPTPGSGLRWLRAQEAWRPS
jgi:hypothetical protein